MVVKFVKHRECSLYLLKKICSLKKQHWNYPIKEQLQWLNDNLALDDIHVCIIDREKLIAYCSILTVEYQLNNQGNRHALGIGSVCVDKNHLNEQLGFLIIQLASFYIRKCKSIGFLICKEELVPFYEKCNWIYYKGDVEILNYQKPFKLLSTSPLMTDKIMFNKSF